MHYILESLHFMDGDNSDSGDYEQNMNTIFELYKQFIDEHNEKFVFNDFFQGYKMKLHNNYHPHYHFLAIKEDFFLKREFFEFHKKHYKTIESLCRCKVEDTEICTNRERNVDKMTRWIIFVVFILNCLKILYSLDETFLLSVIHREIQQTKNEVHTKNENEEETIKTHCLMLFVYFYEIFGKKPINMDQVHRDLKNYYMKKKNNAMIQRGQNHEQSKEIVGLMKFFFEKMCIDNLTQEHVNNCEKVVYVFQSLIAESHVGSPLTLDFLKKNEMNLNKVYPDEFFKSPYGLSSSNSERSLLNSRSSSENITPLSSARSGMSDSSSHGNENFAVLSQIQDVDALKNVEQFDDFMKTNKFFKKFNEFLQKLNKSNDITDDDFYMRYLQPSVDIDLSFLSNDDKIKYLFTLECLKTFCGNDVSKTHHTNNAINQFFVKVFSMNLSETFMCEKKNGFFDTVVNKTITHLKTDTILSDFIKKIIDNVTKHEQQKKRMTIKSYQTNNTNDHLKKKLFELFPNLETTRDDVYMNDYVDILRKMLNDLVSSKQSIGGKTRFNKYIRKLAHKKMKKTRNHHLKRKKNKTIKQ